MPNYIDGVCVPRWMRDDRNRGKSPLQSKRPSKKAGLKRSRFHPDAKKDANRFGWSKHKRRVKRNRRGKK